MARVYIYVVDRDFGFAPNPFHGCCSLATCKPRIRNSASVEDWIIGVGGGALKATGRCVFAMKVTQTVTYDQYWTDPDFADKKPVRNGSKKMMVGDNIYHRDIGVWRQAPSHHSLPDGSLNVHNRDRDTQSENVLLSKCFYYFGSSAPEIPVYVLEALPYKNGIGHRVYEYERAAILIEWIQVNYGNKLNCVVADPFNFDKSDVHYSVETNRLTKGVF